MAFFDGNHVAMGLYQLLIAGFIMVINQKFFSRNSFLHAMQCSEKIVKIIKLSIELILNNVIINLTNHKGVVSNFLLATFSFKGKGA